MKRNDTPCKGNTPTFISITGAHALMVMHSVFPVMAGFDYRDALGAHQEIIIVISRKANKQV